jgi:hypothetical protein
MSNRSRSLLAAALLFAVAGCSERTVQGDEVIYKFAPWVAVAVVAGSLAVAGFGVFRFQRGERSRGVVLLVVALLFLVAIGPGMVLDQVALGPDRFYLNTGFWFAPNRHEVRLSDVARASVEVEFRQGRYGKKKSYYLNFDLKSGQKDRVPVGDLMKQAFPEIVATLQEHDIPLYIPPEEQNP